MPGAVQDSRHLFGLAAFVIVIAEHADDRDRAGAQILGEDLGLAGLAEIGEVAAQGEHVRGFGNLARTGRGSDARSSR